MLEELHFQKTKKKEFESYIYWVERLKKIKIKIPLPSILAVNLNWKFPYIVLERLEGDDIGNIFEKLSGEQIKSIAESVATLQNQVSSLPFWGGIQLRTVI